MCLQLRPFLYDMYLVTTDLIVCLFTDGKASPDDSHVHFAKMNKCKSCNAVFHGFSNDFLDFRTFIFESKFYFIINMIMDFELLDWTMSRL